MLRYNKYRMMFLNADGRGGGGQGPSSQQAGAAQTGANSVADPFAGIDLDDLDPEMRKSIEAAKEKFATLQKAEEESKRAALQQTQQAREWQGRYDKMLADLKKAGGQDPQADPNAELVSKMEQELIKGGVTAENAKAQAPLMVNMMKVYGEEIKNQIGRDLGPLANSVMQREAESAWNEALRNDRLGVLNDQTLGKKIWENVQALVQNGQVVNAQVVNNLKHMAYSEHLEAGGQPLHQAAPTQQQQQQQQQPPMYPPNHQPPQPPNFPNFGGGGFYGGGGAPYQPPTLDPNAPRHQLNGDTHQALLATFSKMGAPRLPKGLGGK